MSRALPAPVSWLVGPCNGAADADQAVPGTPRRQVAELVERETRCCYSSRRLRAVASHSMRPRRRRRIAFLQA